MAENSYAPGGRFSRQNCGTDQTASGHHHQQARNSRDTATGTPSINPIVLRNYQDQSSVLFDTLYTKAAENGLLCSSSVCGGSLMAGKRMCRIRAKDDILKEAEDFIDQYYDHLPKQFNRTSRQRRWDEIVGSVDSSGTYQHTPSELVFGAKAAWRNAPRCVGRIQWSRLQVYDARAVKTTVAMYEAICDHLKYSTNGGNIRSALTVFGSDASDAICRLWNAQYIRYAGYENADGTVLGDPASVQLTRVCQRLGWKASGERSRFDILPLVLSVGDDDPDFFALPPSLTLEVPLVHPRYPKFNLLDLKWYAVPAVSNMALNCGGLYYPACGFNGWYQSTEIVRNFCDESRYNMLKEIAASFDVDTGQAPVFWKDIAIAELNNAIIYSFQSRGVTIVDQYSSSESFITHMRTDHKLRGGCPADWVWIIPPVNPGATQVFHQEMLNYKLLPSYEYQQEPWLDHQWKNNGDSALQRTKKFTFRDVACALKLCSKMMSSALARRVLCTIIYATETGKSEGFARRLQDVFRCAFNTQVYRMDEYDCAAIEHESLVLVVTSTFGNGEPPENGKEFYEFLCALKEQKLDDSKRTRDERKDSTYYVGPIFSVFGLGSRAYPSYCAFAHSVDAVLEDIGGRRLLPIADGDDLRGQEESFCRWATSLFKAACDIFCIGATSGSPKQSLELKESTGWSADKYNLVPFGKDKWPSTAEGLSQLHKRQVKQLSVLSTKCLDTSQGRMIQVCLKKPDDIVYAPGDHIAVFPENKEEWVRAILLRTRVDGSMPSDLPVRLHCLEETSEDDVSWKPVARLPVCSLETALKFYLDVSTPPTRSFLCALSACVSSEGDRQTLTRLITDAEEYERWREKLMPSLPDLLELLPSLTFPATLLLALLPVLQPRYYSVSSSPGMYPAEVHLTVSVVKYSVGEGGACERVRYGLCSNWLKSLDPGAVVRGFVKPAPGFHMPSDRLAPIIMVGPGSGVAPFRGFWQEREYSLHNGQVAKPNLGEASLFYGCRSITDVAYKSEVEFALKSGALTAAYTAFSRETFVPKTYVQDELKKRSQEVYDVLYNRGGHLYICGDVTMAADVTKTVTLIMQECGQLSKDDALETMTRIKSTGRLHEDIFGLTLRSTIETTSIKKQEAQRGHDPAADNIIQSEAPGTRKQYDFGKMEKA